ncbi:unnamed protein product [Eruca vesicaria subsp. sativa]|uniref:F-box domain-containing protein n=1 Tax=Eruca vesicaria subsp. sativa TaxID=29727 RepID=A0ABC8JAV7_ERUVS|nr:unnamed protein product [Eruca vesicaria subsp. sativa]
MERAAKLARINKTTVIHRINELPDELIMKILSIIPLYKDTVATRLLSKWCQDPWKLVPEVTVEYDDEKSFMSFYYGSLFSNGAPTLGQCVSSLSGTIRLHPSTSGFKPLPVYKFVRKLRFDLFGGTLKLQRCLVNAKP